MLAVEPTVVRRQREHRALELARVSYRAIGARHAAVDAREGLERAAPAPRELRDLGLAEPRARAQERGLVPHVGLVEGWRLRQCRPRPETLVTGLGDRRLPAAAGRIRLERAVW